MIKFLIDECLSPALAEHAQKRGYGESSHIVWMKRGGWLDWELMPIIIAGDWTFVTRNAADFRGPDAKRGSKGQYAAISIHAGLVCLNGPNGMDRRQQIELFDRALDEIVAGGDLINQVLEIIADGGEPRILRYALPVD